MHSNGEMSTLLDLTNIKHIKIMTNAKKEFTNFVTKTSNITLKELENNNIVGDAIWDHVRRIKCVEIHCSKWNWEKDDPDCTSKDILLKAGYSQKEFNKFLEELDFEYYNGYGSQELYGTIWFQDGESPNPHTSNIDIIGTWATRGEYDGSEWWVHHECPDLQIKLVPEDKSISDYTVIDFEGKGLRNARFDKSLNEYIEIE